MQSPQQENDPRVLGAARPVWALPGDVVGGHGAGPSVEGVGSGTSPGIVGSSAFAGSEMGSCCRVPRGRKAC